MDVSRESVSTEDNIVLDITALYIPTHFGAIDYVIVAVSLLGIVGNFVSVVVWNTHTTFNAIIFLFKYLAMWDTVLLLSTFFSRVLTYFRRSVLVSTYSVLIFILYTMTMLGQTMSVNSTLMIAVCRFLVVSRPLQVYNGTLLTRHQIILACVVLFIWGLLISIPYLVITLLTYYGKLQASHFTPLAIYFLGLIFPIILMVVFNILLLKKLRSSSLMTSSTTSAQHPELWGRSQRVTLVVVLMSLFSVLAYLLGGTIVACVFMYIHFSEPQGKPTGCRLLDILVSVYELFQVINSSINIIFYYAFFHNFCKVFPTVGIKNQVPESSTPTRTTMNKTFIR